MENIKLYLKNTRPMLKLGESLFKTNFKILEWGWPRRQCQTWREIVLVATQIINCEIGSVIESIPILTGD